MLTGLHEEREHLTDPEFNAVSDRVVELVCMLTAGDDRPDAPGQLGEVEAMVRRYVRDHVADPHLTGTAVAHALGWSLRQIQLALQKAGTTPRELIREERLRLVRDRLLCAECDHMTITDLAYSVGFSSASALSTAFHAALRRQPPGDAPEHTLTQLPLRSRELRKDRMTENHPSSRFSHRLPPTFR